MIRMTKIVAIATTALFALGFFSCSNVQDNSALAIPFEAPAPEASVAYITLSIEDSVSRTVLPYFDKYIGLDDFVLKGSKDGGEQKTLGSWSDKSQMQSASVPIELGYWTFTLTAKHTGFYGSKFSGTSSKEIVAGQNTLAFNLSFDDIGIGHGSFSLTLTFDGAANAQNVSRVVGSLENMDKTIAHDGLTNLAVSNNTVTFSGSVIKAGTYRAKIKFYASDNGVDMEIASWSELVLIASYLNSSASRTIESFDDLYTITYELNGGSFADAAVVPETFTRRSNVTLPSLENVIRNDSDYGGTYKALGWYTDENCSAGNEITSVENIAQNITVYAKWPQVYTITYNLNGGAFANGYAPREKFIQSDVVELPESECFLRDYYIFGGWYTDENCTEENKVTAIENMSGNVAVYAKWTPVIYKITSRLGVYCSETTYTVEDDVTLSQPSYEEIVFNAWYEDEACSGNSVAGWNAGERHGDIALYADYTMPVNVNVDKNSIARVIGLMKSSGTITATGDFNNDDFKSARNALLELNKFRPDVLVTLDLANVNIAESSSGEIILPHDAFADCSSLKSITLPDGLTFIGLDAFANCSSLKSITIPGGVKKIGESGYVCYGAFGRCSALESITLPDGLTFIGDSTFSGCSSLKSITIPDSVTYLGDSTFAYCSSLKSITIPDSVTYLGYQAFDSCSSLTDVTLSNSLTEIESSAFNSCSSLKSITIPDSVTCIWNRAFYGCSSLTDVTLSNNLTEINKLAFADCSSLTSITIPGSVTYIERAAFYGCIQLNNAIFMDSTSAWYRVEQDFNGVDVYFGEHISLGRMSNPSTNAYSLRVYSDYGFYKEK